MTTSAIDYKNKMKLSELIASSSGAPVHTYEFFPPRTAPGLQNLLDRISRLSSSPLLPPLAISVTWGAGGSTATRSLELAEEIVNLDLGREGRRVEVILHLTCTNMSKSLVDEALKKCRELGIQNVLALRGDPPRKEEYRPHPGPDPEFAAKADDHGVAVDEEQDFEYAEDLVRYIRKQHSDWFCIGVAGYPTPHPDSASPQSDIQYLGQKVAAGADFIITQLFYDVEGFLAWVGSVRAAGVHVPIIPGIMPIQNYASFRRLTNLCRCPVPDQLLHDLEPIRVDDAAVKRYGIQLATRMVRQITSSPQAVGVPGVHFCTLNLEKSVRNVLENLGWTSNASPQQEKAVNGNGPSLLSAQRPQHLSPEMQPTSTATNRLIEPDTDIPHAQVLSTSPQHGKTLLSISPSEASSRAAQGFKQHQERERRRSTLSSERPPKPIQDEQTTPGPNQANTGANTGLNTGGGGEDSWDEYPNGRFTDVRSPAYGEIDGYGNGLKITPAQALKDWGAPVDVQDLSKLFCSYLRSAAETPTTPFCDMPISAESSEILSHVLRLNSPDMQFWTVGSQPAVDGAKSEDPIHGWGPKGGWVFQKSFVEFFVKDATEVERIKKKIETKGNGWVSFYAGNRSGDFVTNMTEQDVNAVTWAVFPGQEIVQSTMIEQESFLAWKEEAFEIWTEWARLYPTRSASRKLLDDIADKSWLVSVIHHDYKDKEALWRFLVEQ